MCSKKKVMIWFYDMESLVLVARGIIIVICLLPLALQALYWNVRPNKSPITLTRKLNIVYSVFVCAIIAYISLN